MTNGNGKPTWKAVTTILAILVSLLSGAGWIMAQVDSTEMDIQANTERIYKIDANLASIDAKLEFIIRELDKK